MKRLSVLILIFAIAFAFFFIAPAMLNKPFSPYPLIKIADMLDLFTPLVLIPLYYLLLYNGANQHPTLRTTIVFLIFAAVWVEGQGIHLAANSIGHWLTDLTAGEINQLIYFYDEVLSHFIWHVGVLALSAQLIYRGWRYSFQNQASPLILETIAGIIYAFLIFIIGIEGGSVPLVFTFSALAVLFGLIWGRGRYRNAPVMTFFTIGYGLATVFYLGWWIYWGSFPQFSHLGWI